MKLVALGLLALSANTNAKLGSSCSDDGNLVIDIPYPDERTATLLFLEAGSCNQDTYGGSFVYDAVTKHAKVTIPIEACGLKGALYDTPVTTRSYYQAMANVTFGTKVGETNLVFRSMLVAAECGKRTSYTVGFEYVDIASKDNEGCVIVDGACVFPAYEDNIELEIQEFTDHLYTTRVTEETRAKLAGKPIYLSLKATTIDDDYKFAVMDCSIVDGTPDTEGYKKFPVMNAGVLTDANCGIDGINFGAAYHGTSGSFNFQHTLFLFRTEDVSSFKLTCTVEICLKSDKSSKCNRAASVCMDNDGDKKNYMCGVEVCDTNVCSIENNEPKCVVCTCANGVEATGAACLSDGDETCASCSASYYLSGTSCLSNVCICANGVEATGDACLSDGDENCASCSAGYYSSETPWGATECLRNVCSCTDGVEATGAACLNDGDATCASCSTGYYLSGTSCLKKISVQLMFEQGSDISKDKTVWTIRSSRSSLTCTLDFQMSRDWVEGQMHTTTDSCEFEAADLGVMTVSVADISDDGFDNWDMNGNWLVVDGVRANSMCHMYWWAGDGSKVWNTDTYTTKIVAPVQCKTDIPSTIPSGYGIALGCYMDCGTGSRRGGNPDFSHVGGGGVLAANGFYRDLPNEMADIPTSPQQGSISWCVDQCLSAGYDYAGIQNTNECYCGDEFGQASYREGECTDICTDGSSDTCGASCRSEIFSTGYA